MKSTETKQLFTELTTEESASVNGGAIQDISWYIASLPSYLWNLSYSFFYPLWP